MDEAMILRILAEGEGQSVEFKREFPKKARSLGKEIAAFATSNRGVILVGVDDAGTVVGLKEAASEAGRRRLAARVEGICQSSIKPIVSPRITFPIVNRQRILAIEVEKGVEPLYFADERPCVRQVSMARGATPEEVRNLVVGDELISRIEALEARRTAEQSTAAGIMGQGELATMSVLQLMERLANAQRWKM